jgi:hypothetical protein
MPFFFVCAGEPNRKRWFVFCEDFAQTVMHKITWSDMLKSIGRSNEAMEVHYLHKEKHRTVLGLMHGYF